VDQENVRLQNRQPQARNKTKTRRPKSKKTIQINRRTNKQRNRLFKCRIMDKERKREIIKDELLKIAREYKNSEDKEIDCPSF